MSIGYPPAITARAGSGWQSSRASDGAWLMLLVHHTDADREWAYDRKSMIGRLDKALDEANQRGWTVVDMQQDWRVIYPVELR